TECDKAFYENHHLIRHMRVHTGEKPFQCSNCKRSFAEKGTLNSHIKTFTDNGERFCQAKPPKDRPHICSQCDRAFIRNEHLIRHIQNIHNKGENYTRKETYSREESYQCNLCKKSFSDHSTLYRHLMDFSDNGIRFCHLKDRIGE
ncbi:unnamed protein product, partial [Meganyctiphanes norvegica]